MMSPFLKRSIFHEELRFQQMWTGRTAGSGSMEGLDDHDRVEDNTICGPYYLMIHLESLVACAIFALALKLGALGQWQTQPMWSKDKEDSGQQRITKLNMTQTVFCFHLGG